MCFAPYVSLSTFLIEFLLAGYFLFRAPRDKLNRVIALITLSLGVYQLNEFLICVTGVVLFTKLAIMTTAFMPAMAVSYALVVYRKKLKYYWHVLLYSPAVFFIVMFGVFDWYNSSAFCSTVFIKFPSAGLMGKFFGLYYGLYLAAGIILFVLAASSTESEYEKKFAYLGLLGTVIFVMSTFVFLLFLPALKYHFPSVLCEFALLFAIEMMVVLWYKDKHGLKY